MRYRPLKGIAGTVFPNCDMSLPYFFCISKPWTLHNRSFEAHCNYLPVIIWIFLKKYQNPAKSPSLDSSKVTLLCLIGEDVAQI